MMDADTIAVIKTGLTHHGIEVEAYTNTGGLVRLNTSLPCFLSNY